MTHCKCGHKMEFDEEESKFVCPCCGSTYKKELQIVEPDGSITSIDTTLGLAMMSGEVSEEKLSELGYL